jgi:hypothetical protein
VSSEPVKHSPLPWRVTQANEQSGIRTHGIETIGDGPDGLSMTIADLNDDAFEHADIDSGAALRNAEFIVRACNSHYDLIRMLNVYRLVCGSCGDLRCGVCRKADELIAKAEGR